MKISHWQGKNPTKSLWINCPWSWVPGKVDALQNGSRFFFRAWISWMQMLGHFWMNISKSLWIKFAERLFAPPDRFVHGDWMGRNWKMVEPCWEVWNFTHRMCWTRWFNIIYLVLAKQNQSNDPVKLNPVLSSSLFHFELRGGLNYPQLDCIGLISTLKTIRRI